MFLILLINLIVGESFEHAVVYGNTESLGYYYVDIWVGTPSMRQTVIIDTGSRLTAFPCVGCENCGKHIDLYFDYKKSNTSRLVQCNEGVSCSSCDNDVCGYSQSYAEGSSISGILVEDDIMFGDDFAYAHRVRAVFGCHRRETYLFRTQQVDGIMGLAQQKNNMLTLVDVLYKNQDIDSNVFAICFGKEDGVITIGGYNSSIHLSSPVWASLYDDSFYAIKLHFMVLNGNRVPITATDFTSLYTTGTIVDSGTTFTYFSSKIYLSLLEAFNKFCLEEGNCDGELKEVYGEAHVCYKYDYKKYTDISDFFSTFPSFKLGIDDVEVEWKAKYYLFAWPETPNTFCIGIYGNGVGGNVLGGNFMRGNDIIFNRENKKIGFASSDCIPDYPHNKSRLIIPTYKKRVNDIGVFSVVLGSCGLTSIASLTILYIWRKRSKSQVNEENQEV